MLCDNGYTDNLKRIKQIKIDLEDTDIENPARGRVTSSDQLYRAFKYLENAEFEKVIAVYFSGDMEITMFDVLALGNLSLRPKDVFAGAIVTKASGFVVLHNHSRSAEPDPSPFDAAMIEMMEKKAPIMDIDFINYLVIGHGEYWRLREDDTYAPPEPRRRGTDSHPRDAQ